MFPREKRLTRKSFLSITKGGDRVSSVNFSATVSNKINGYSVVLSKKAAPLSVTRHKIKRRVINALKELSLPRAMVVYPRSAASKMTYQDIKTELKELLSKISR